MKLKRNSRVERKEPRGLRVSRAGLSREAKPDIVNHGTYAGMDS